MPITPDTKSFKAPGAERARAESGAVKKEAPAILSVDDLERSIEGTLQSFPETTEKLKSYKEGLENEYESLHKPKLEVIREEEEKVKNYEQEIKALSTELESTQAEFDRAEKELLSFEEQRAKLRASLFQLGIEKGITNLPSQKLDTNEELVDALTMIETKQGAPSIKASILRSEANKLTHASAPIEMRKVLMERDLLEIQRELGQMQQARLQSIKLIKSEMRIVSEFLNHDLKYNAERAKQASG